MRRTTLVPAHAEKLDGMPTVFDFSTESDLPCPWCAATTNESDVRCPNCDRRFG